MVFLWYCSSNFLIFLFLHPLAIGYSSSTSSCHTTHLPPHQFLIRFFQLHLLDFHISLPLSPPDTLSPTLRSPPPSPPPLLSPLVLRFPLLLLSSHLPIKLSFFLSN